MELYTTKNMSPLRRAPLLATPIATPLQCSRPKRPDLLFNFSLDMDQTARSPAPELDLAWDGHTSRTHTAQRLIVCSAAALRWSMSLGHELACAVVPPLT